jgi:hypothetical protein
MPCPNDYDGRDGLCHKLFSEKGGNKVFADAVGERAALWIAPDAPHTGAFGRYPDEYEQRVVAFFEATLISND